MDLDVSLDSPEEFTDRSAPGSCGSYPGCSTGDDGRDCTVFGPTCGCPRP